jgi:NADH:ubiquinone oxidoreductase subunit 6 (subunit J)
MNDVIIDTFTLIFGAIALLALIGVVVSLLMKSSQKSKSKKSMPSYGSDNSTIARDLQDKYKTDRSDGNERRIN